MVGNKGKKVKGAKESRQQKGSEKGQKKTGGRKAVKREQKKGGRKTSFLVRVWRAGFANLLQKLFL